MRVSEISSLMKELSYQRQTGRTEIIAKAIALEGKGVVLAANKIQADQIQKVYGVKSVSIGNPMIRAMDTPMIMDNHTVETLIWTLIKAVEERDEAIVELKHEVLRKFASVIASLDT